MITIPDYTETRSLSAMVSSQATTESRITVKALTTWYPLTYME